MIYFIFSHWMENIIIRRVMVTVHTSTYEDNEREHCCTFQDYEKNQVILEERIFTQPIYAIGYATQPKENK